MAVNGAITRAGAAYLSQRIATMTDVLVDHFVMANIPDINENTPADQDYELDESYIVGTAPVYRLSHNGENAVVYSMVLDANVGDFDFNWYGLVSDTGEILAFAHIPQVSKRAAVGQVINRNFILPFTAAKVLTGADIPAESWQFDFTETIAEVTVSMKGPNQVWAGESYTFTFNDWDDFSTYTVSASVGTATLGNSILTLDIPANEPSGTCLLTIIRNGATRAIPIRIGEPIVAKPTLIEPAQDSEVYETPTLTTSPFKTFPSGHDTQLSADWEIFNASGSLIYSSYDDQVNKSTLTVPEDVLIEGGYGYKWRKRDNGNVIGAGEWSDFSEFITVSKFFPTVPGEPFGGGYFAGYMDPSDGPRYALIVAPKASGEALQLDYKTEKSTDGATSYWDGQSITASIDDSAHPAAQFCASLSIAGFGDWYLPARDELELLFRNLKGNSTVSAGDRYESGMYGENENSDPDGVAYSGTYPAMTSAAIFQVGGAEAFELTIYWSSTEEIPQGGGSAWYQNFYGGMQSVNGKINNYNVRAVRRVLLD